MKGFYSLNGSLLSLLFFLIITCTCEFATSSLSVDYLGFSNGSSVQETSGACSKRMLSPVTISWLSSGRPSFLLSEYASSLLALSGQSIFEPVPQGFFGIPPCFHQPTLHPYSERSTAKEADNSGRTSNEWNIWLALLIAMVAAAILS